MDAILDEVRKQDLAVIFQAWIDADRMEHDPLKHKSLSTILTGELHERTPSAEFLAQLRAFINDPANSQLDRAVLVSVLGDAQRKETAEMLLDMAAKPPAPELKNNVLGSLGMAGALNNQDESLSPTYERAWRETARGNEDLLRSVACSMAGLGSASSLELVLNAALAPDGQDDARKHAALYALAAVTILNDHAVPPLAARLSNDTPTNEASRLAAGALARMVGTPSNRVLVAWMQAATAAAPLAHKLALGTQSPAIWQAALDPSVPFRSEQNRAAIRAALNERNKK